MRSDANLSTDDEDVLSIGPRSSRVTHRDGRRRRRWQSLMAVAGLAAGLLIIRATGHDQPRSVDRPPSLPVAVPPPDDSALHAVPAQDMRLFLAATNCRATCVAQFPDPGVVRTFTAAYTSLRVVAAGTVVRAGRQTVFLTVEGRADHDTLVHLTARYRPGPRVTSVPAESRSEVDGSQTVALRGERDGWYLQAELVARGIPPSVLTARRWLAGATLPE